MDLPTLTKPELWRDILAILSALTHQPSGTNRTYIAALIEVSGHFDSVKQIQLVKSMEDVAASEVRAKFAYRNVLGPSKHRASPTLAICHNSNDFKLCHNLLGRTLLACRRFPWT